jgi:hypothetical protein
VLSQKENTDTPVTPRGRLSSSESRLSGLEVKHSTHWPEKGKVSMSGLSVEQKKTNNKENCVFLQKM